MTIDLNTVLNVVVLGLCSWTLYTVHELAKSHATAAEHVRAQDERLNENRRRIMDAETKIGTLQVDVGKLQTGPARR